MQSAKPLDVAIARCDGHVKWLCEQLEKWPTRVHPDRTTSIRYLYDTSKSIVDAIEEVRDMAKMQGVEPAFAAPLDAALADRLTKAHAAFHARHRFL